MSEKQVYNRVSLIGNNEDLKDNKLKKKELGCRQDFRTRFEQMPRSLLNRK